MDVDLLAAFVGIGGTIVVAGLWIVIIRQMRPTDERTTTEAEELGLSYKTKASP
jgi:hypothetical protein